jgi:hypothetical protein
VRELPEGQQAYDRPDICSRVFELKVQDLIKNVLKAGCFGTLTGYIGTVEFQKRGLPHVHIIVILNSADRPQTPDQYDKFVSCKIPDQATHPQLYDTVTKCMIHGPCGRSNPGASCMVDGRCKDGYPVYRRRPNGPSHHFSRSQFLATNQHVVPYNPYLSQRYNSHINVEISTSSRAVKYLCKYITKGSDRAQLQMQKTTMMKQKWPSMRLQDTKTPVTLDLVKLFGGPSAIISICTTPRSLDWIYTCQKNKW